MVSRECTIQNEIGLHARPAALFVKEASKFQSEISVVKEEKTVNGKSLLGLLSLAVTKGTRIELRAIGPDEDEAIAALSDLLENQLK